MSLREMLPEDLSTDVPLLAFDLFLNIGVLSGAGLAYL